MGGGGGAVSHGRGGAGNMYSKATHKAQTTPKDLVTPTIKQDIYTTGRGGSGNMVHNDPRRPEIARGSQDVESPPQRVEEAPHHTGRGGAANAYFPPPDEEEKIRLQEEKLRREQLKELERTKTNERLERTKTNEKGQSPASNQ